MIPSLKQINNQIVKANQQKKRIQHKLYILNQIKHNIKMIEFYSGRGYDSARMRNEYKKLIKQYLIDLKNIRR